MSHLISSLPHLWSTCSWVRHVYPSPEAQRLIFTTNWSSVFGFYEGISNLVYSKPHLILFSKSFFQFFPKSSPYVSQTPSFLNLIPSDTQWALSFSTLFQCFCNPLLFCHSSATVSGPQYLSAGWYHFDIQLLYTGLSAPRLFPFQSFLLSSSVSFQCKSLSNHFSA